jgi:hypothetical protein
MTCSCHLHERPYICRHSGCHRVVSSAAVTGNMSPAFLEILDNCKSVPRSAGGPKVFKCSSTRMCCASQGCAATLSQPRRVAPHVMQSVAPLHIILCMRRHRQPSHAVPARPAWRAPVQASFSRTVACSSLRDPGKSWCPWEILDPLELDLECLLSAANLARTTKSERVPTLGRWRDRMRYVVVSTNKQSKRLFEVLRREGLSVRFLGRPSTHITFVGCENRSRRDVGGIEIYATRMLGITPTLKIFVVQHDKVSDFQWCCSAIGLKTYKICSFDY